MQNKAPYTVRLAVPRQGVTTVEDGVYGTVHFDNEQIDDQVFAAAATLSRESFALTRHFAPFAPVPHVDSGQDGRVPDVPFRQCG